MTSHKTIILGCLLTVATIILIADCGCGNDAERVPLDVLADSLWAASVDTDCQIVACVVPPYRRYKWPDGTIWWVYQDSVTGHWLGCEDGELVPDSVKALCK